ncbi:MAG TPA: hypothetical protein VGP68_02090 [Gemmataceae bacterium]|jgi:adenylate cyclase|nr:hypothetical protein [Gemmataceae bacterium]
MNTALRLTILQGAEELLSLETWEPIIIGRQTGHDQKPPSYRSREQKCRVTLAGRDSAVVSREHLLIEVQDASRIRVTNQSPRHGVQLPNRVTLNSRESQELDLPASLGIANWVLRIELPNAEDAPLRALEEAPPSPLASIGHRRPFPSLPVSQDKENPAELYLRFLEISLIRLQASTDVKMLCDQAAHCCAELLELDSVWVFLLEENEWAVKAWARRGDLAREKAGDASRFVLGKVREEKRTFWLTSQAVGLGVLPSVAAAPLLDSQGAVIGAIYGHRLATSDSLRVPVNRLLALSVELVASAVSSELVRRQQGQGDAPSGSFADYFPPQVSRRVVDSPQILDDREQDIALLECEIRDFDAVIAQLGLTEASLRLQEVFDPVCECIGDQQGVVNDYCDARVRAFFGAPLAQTEFLIQAAKAATAIHERVSDLGKRWRNDLGRSLDIGIVLDVGRYHVGRRGSRTRFKYGTWSKAWQIVDKIQQAGRVLRTPLTVSKAARTGIPHSFAGRRLGLLEGAGWAEPLELFEIIEPSNKAFAIRGSYEEALACFERGDFEATTQRLSKILADHPSDVPAYLLQMRAIQAKLNKGTASTGVLKLLDTGS